MHVAFDSQCSGRDVLETVLVTGKVYTTTATWTGSSWLADIDIKEPILHWQRLPASPEYEKMLEEGT